MREQITTFVQACPACQKNKRKQKQYGHLPPKVAEATIWDKMCIDLIGPYKIRCKGKPDLECKCVTMIDPASDWFEIHQYNDKDQSLWPILQNKNGSADIHGQLR